MINHKRNAKKFKSKIQALLWANKHNLTALDTAVYIYMPPSSNKTFAITK